MKTLIEIFVLAFMNEISCDVRQSKIIISFYDRIFDARKKEGKKPQMTT